MSPCFSSLCRTIHAPWSLKRSTTFSGSNWLGGPTLNLLGGSESTFGNRKRTVPSSMPIMDAEKAVQAMPNQDPNIAASMTTRNVRRACVFAGAFGGAGLGGTAGFGGAAVTAVSAGFGGADVTAVGGFSLGWDIAFHWLPV